MNPLILDLDGSVGALPGASHLDVRAWEDRLRFACADRQLREFRQHLDVVAPAPASHGTVYYGSGDFHHVSLALMRRAATQPMRVLVFDNHPDNMRFPFGVHCGSWVSRAAALPCVTGIDVVGITSNDIALAHCWENRLWPLYAGRVRYWSIGVDARWSRWAGLARSFRCFDSATGMLDALLAELERDSTPVYLSIDKDVLDAADAPTNWDQGCLRVWHLQEAIAALRGRLVGSDVNGEISMARYSQRWKRLLSAIDGQQALDPANLVASQARQHAVNLTLCQAFAKAYAR